MKRIKGFRLIGIALKNKTSNENGQSAIDCGNLWQKFEKEEIFNRIQGKISNEIFAVYHNYEGDYTKPFSYFIGCKVNPELNVPSGLDSFIIQDGNYQIFTAKGKIPDCIASAWAKIWSSDIPRAYQVDFEIYGEKSKDWTNSEIDIFISVK
jgi:predicted transcriptional regulator YdeE